ncbi:MAG: molecular chaperone TorD family protein [Dehalococcoidia bacterium]
METGVRLERLRAQIFGNFAAIYLNLPDLDFARSISEGRYVSAAGFDAVADLVPASTNGEESPAELASAGLADIQRYVDESKGTPVDTLKTDLGVERTRLVRGIARGYGPPPPYGMTWKAPSPAAMGRLGKFLKELDFSAPNNENPTYIGVELSFLTLVCERIAAAPEGSAEADHLVEIRDEFVREHVITWVPAYCEAVVKDTKLDFYRGISRLLIASLDSFGFPRPVKRGEDEDEDEDEDE